MLHTRAPVFDFRLADLKDRLPTWRPEELMAVREVVDAVWAHLLVAYPLELGYFSDSAAALDLLDWCALPLTPHLDSLLAVGTLPATRHLADLLDAVFTNRKSFESAFKATVLDWVKNSAVGEALQSAFFDADSGDAAQQLSRAHELWTTCARS
jgi:hypothetical protein